MFRKRRKPGMKWVGLEAGAPPSNSFVPSKKDKREMGVPFFCYFSQI